VQLHGGENVSEFTEWRLHCRYTSRMSCLEGLKHHMQLIDADTDQHLHGDRRFEAAMQKVQDEMAVQRANPAQTETAANV